MTIKYSSHEWTLNVPLDHRFPDGPAIEIFAREIWTSGNKNKDIFVFLQGGPGFPAPRDPNATAWMPEILKDFRILLVDQRGTGRSSPIGPDTASLYPDPAKLAEYLSCFRADNTVRDLECLREKILKKKKWYLLGQSYGGFLSFSYLSFYPEGLKGVLTTGGCPPLTASHPKFVYERLLDGVEKRNHLFYKTYPGDKIIVKKIVDQLHATPILLPDGGVLTAERFLDVGLKYLGMTGGFESLHHSLDIAFKDSTQTDLSYAFIDDIWRGMHHESNPIYVVLHEALYCEGYASAWASDALLKSRAEFAPDAEVPLFYGENMRHSMLDEYALLRCYRDAALLLAEKKDWPALYDRSQLSVNEVPVECLIYESDLYVDTHYSLETVALTKNAKAQVHPDWHHDSIRTQSKKVIGMLLPRLLKRVTSQKKKAPIVKKKKTKVKN